MVHDRTIPSDCSFSVKVGLGGNSFRTLPRGTGTTEDMGRGGYKDKKKTLLLQIDLYI